MTLDRPPKIWSAYGGRVAAFDFTQKPIRPYSAAKGPQEVVGLLDYHEDGYEADMLCARCFWRGNMMLTAGYPVATISCPACRCDGGMVRG